VKVRGIKNNVLMWQQNTIREKNQLFSEQSLKGEGCYLNKMSA
jgi:hypothetical protein